LSTASARSLDDVGPIRNPGCVAHSPAALKTA
jgi:hypothetical protein